MTLYQVPFSPELRQIVTCRTPRRILCDGCDMVISFSLFSDPTIGALRHAIESASVRGKASAATGQAENWGQPSGGTDFPLERPGGRFIVPVLRPPEGLDRNGEDGHLDDGMRRVL